MAAICEFCIGRKCVCAPVSPGQRYKHARKLVFAFCEEGEGSILAFVQRFARPETFLVQGASQELSEETPHPDSVLIGDYPPGFNARLCAVVAAYEWGCRAPEDSERGKEARSHFARLHGSVVTAMFASEPVFRDTLQCVLADVARAAENDFPTFVHHMWILREATKHIEDIQWRMLINTTLAGIGAPVKWGMEMVSKLCREASSPKLRSPLSVREEAECMFANIANKKSIDQGLGRVRVHRRV